MGSRSGSRNQDRHTLTSGSLSKRKRDDSHRGSGLGSSKRQKQQRREQDRDGSESELNSDDEVNNPVNQARSDSDHSSDESDSDDSNSSQNNLTSASSSSAPHRRDFEDEHSIQATFKKSKFDDIFKGAPHLIRIASLDIQPRNIISHGILHEAALNVGTESSMSERDVKTFQTMKHLLPGIVQVHVELKNNKKLREFFYQKLSERMSAGRSTDSNKGKSNIRKILEDIGNPPTDTPVKDTGSKVDFGFHNDTTGRLLCPVSLDWDDHSIRQKLLDGTIPATSKELPRLAYANCIYDENDVEAGLLRNKAAIKLAKVIFTSPSSINLDISSKAATRKCNAKLAGLTSMTPRTIAYVHCQLRFLLSTRPSFTLVDGAFNLLEFYWMLVKIIEGDEDFKTDLIAYWNSQIFGSSGGCVTSNSEDFEDARHPSAWSRIDAQRAAKRAAAAANAGAAALLDLTNTGT